MGSLEPHRGEGPGQGVSFPGEGPSVPWRGPWGQDGGRHQVCWEPALPQLAV